MDADDAEAIKGNQLWRFQYSRMQAATLYVYGTKEDAEADAEVIIDHFGSKEWTQEDPTLEAVDEVRSIPPGCWAWSGGEDGSEVYP